MPQITALYLGLSAVFLAVISMRISFMRLRTGATFADGDDRQLANAIRLQGNFIEYAPTAMLLILVAELMAMPAWVLHLFGMMFVIGRALHLIGFTSRPQKLGLRKLGMVLTYAMLMVAGLANIGYALF